MILPTHNPVIKQFEAVVAPSGPRDYTTLQAAVAAGATRIFVRNGTYTLTENLLLPTGIVLVGESEKGVIVEGDGQYRMYILGDGAAQRYSTGAVRFTRGNGYFEGLADELGNSPDWAALDGLKNTMRFMGTSHDLASLGPGNTCTPLSPPCGPSVDWDSFDYDLAVERANYYIANMTLTNGDVITDAKSSLLFIVSAHSVVLERLRIIGSGIGTIAQEPRGCYIYLCEDVTVHNCHVSHIGGADGGVDDLLGGITVAFCHNVSIRGNRVHDCHQNGIFVRACKHVDINGNRVSNCANGGIWDCESAHSSTVNNIVTNCRLGIVACSYHTILNNNVTDTLVGIDISAWPERLNGYPYIGGVYVKKGGMGTKGCVSSNVIARARRYGIYGYGSHTAIFGNQLDEQGYIRNGDIRECYKPAAGDTVQPYNWSAAAGAWGTDMIIVKCDDAGEPAPMFAPHHVKFVPTGTATITMRQELRYRPEVSSNLYLSFWARKTTGATGTMTVILWDGDGTARITKVITEADLTTSGWKWFVSTVYATGAGPLPVGWYLTVSVTGPLATAAFHIDGIRVTDDTCAGIYSQGMSAIQGNVLRGCGAVSPGSSTRAAITASKGSGTTWPANGDVVTGNVIDNAGQIGCNLTNNGAMFTGNHLRGFGLYGLTSQATDNLTATGNLIDYGSGSFPTDGAGIYLITATNATVVGNRIYTYYPVWVQGGGGHVIEHNSYNKSWGMRVQAAGGGVALSTSAYRVNEGMLLSAPTTASLLNHWHVKIGSGLLTVRDKQYEQAVQDDYTMTGTLAVNQSVVVAIVAYGDYNSCLFKAVPGTIVGGGGAAAPSDSVIGTSVGHPGWMRVGITLLVTDGGGAVTQTYNNAVREMP